MVKRYRIVGICKNDEAYEELKEKPDGDLMYYTDFEKLSDIVRDASKYAEMDKHDTDVCASNACDVARDLLKEAMELIDEDTISR